MMKKKRFLYLLLAIVLLVGFFVFRNRAGNSTDLSEPLVSSVLSVIEGTRFISIDHSVTTEDRARLAVKFALAGSSPIKDAAGVFFSESGEVPDVAEYILIDGWYFYSD